MKDKKFAEWTEIVGASETLKTAAKVASLKSEGKHIINFGAGEPDFNTPPKIIEAAYKAIVEGKVRYTSERGIEPLRKVAAQKMKSLYGISYDPFKETVITAGAKQAIFAALCSLLTPKDEVIILAPYWVSYPAMVQIAGGIPVIVHTRLEDSFLPYLPRLKQAITPRTKALILNTPNNPTGMVYPEKLVREISSLAVERDFYLISDEVYDRLILDEKEKHFSPAMVGEEVRKRSLIAFSCSKTYAMTGWRVGYAFGPEPLITNIAKYIGQSTSCVNAAAQYAALYALSSPDSEQAAEEMRKKFIQRKNKTVSLLKEIPKTRFIEPTATFFVLLSVKSYLGLSSPKGTPIKDDSSFCEALLDEECVATVSGTAFGAEGCIRISFATSDEEISEGCARIKRFVLSLK
ncbi:MAG: pyridoxal phosphate-dependent aminotransferase [Planctomycetota bacterium]|nr:pyridoxal phosphate-dependent aminotransferase [Planctomycetota bacterium]